MRSPGNLERILKALETAKRRAKRSNGVIRKLLATATVRIEPAPKEAIVVTFTAPPFRGGYHQFYEQDYIRGASDPELAKALSWGLRESVKKKLKAARALAASSSKS